MIGKFVSQIQKKDVQDFTRICTAMALVGGMMLAGPVLAQSNVTLPDLSIDGGQQSTFIKGLQSWWELVANGMLFGGLAGAIFGFFFGGGMTWVRFGLIIAAIAAFGEPVLKWLLKIGGMKVIA